jgi:N-acetylmuramoyl-L-alanine amidase
MQRSPRNTRMRAGMSQASLLLAILVTLAWQPSSARAASKRERASQAYDRAVQMQAAFNARSQQSHTAKDYLKLARAFDLVYRTDPAYSGTPAAIAAEAEIYREMGGVFFSRSYYQSAAASYQFLADQYPGASVARNALFTAGEVYRVDLEDPDEAAKAYTRYITTYPYAPKVQEAKLHLKELNAHLAAQASLRAKAAEAADSEPAGHANAQGDLVAVNDVHYWEGPDYTRIVVTLADEAKVESQRLSHPDRLVFDLPGTRVSRPLAGKDFSVGNGFVQHIRVAQFKPDTARVVLDVSGLKDYSSFTLPNPYRLIIDVHGPAQAPVAGAPRRSVSTADAGTSRPSAKASHSATGAVAEATPPASASDATWQPFGASGSSRIKPITDPDSTVKEYDLKDKEAGGRAASSPAPVVDTTGGSVESKTGVPAGTGTSPALARTQPSAAASSGSPTLTRALGLKIARIVIDPGHGGHDTGTIGPEGLEEKNVVLDVALRLRKLIEQRMGSEVVMTRTDDTFIPLEERTAIANQRSADLFVSIHANASKDESARGIEVYYLNLTSDPDSLEVAARENATSQESVYQLQNLVKKIALSEKVEESSEFARQVDHSLELATVRNGNGQPDRGLKKAPFVVLIGANMPSILAEISFLTNPRDERLLSKSDYRQQIAEGLYRGIQSYVASLGTLKIAARAGGAVPERRVSAHAPNASAAPGHASSDDPQDY